MKDDPAKEEFYSPEKALDELCSALARSDDPSLIKNFLSELLTPNEIDEIASRWELVCRIQKGISQRTIARDLGLSLCKITRGSKILKNEKSSFKTMIQMAEDFQTTK